MTFPTEVGRYLKHLAASTRADLVYFYCFMWGGDTEFEYAWSFGRREEVSLVVQPDVLSRVARSDGGPARIVELDLLSDVLGYLGVPRPAPFCVLHTRDCPWERFKAGPVRAANPASP